MTHRRPTAAPRPVLSDQHHAAITCELGRLVLAGRGPDRPELRDRMQVERLARRQRFNPTSTGATR